MAAITNPSGFTRQTSEVDVDSFNQWLRAQPWHQSYLQSIGQYGKRINLSEHQQKELASIAQAHGVALPHDFSFDQGANLNQNSRTGRNLAIGAGIVGAAVGAPYLLGALGAGGGAGVGALGTLTNPAAPVVGGLIGGGGAAAGSLASLLGTSAIPSGVNAVGNYFAQRSANNANQRAAELQADATNHGADLQAQANAEQLAFLKAQEDERRKEWQSTQDTNMGLFREREARLQPFRDQGRRSLAQLLTPIRSNSLGSLLGSA